MKEKIKNFFIKIKQQICEHSGSYTQIEYNVNENHRHTVRKCDDCGFGREKYEEAAKFCLEKEITRNNTKI